MYFAGINSLYKVTITSNPQVNGSNNTFYYPILSSVALTCNVTSNDGSLPTVTSYHWNTRCYNNIPFSKYGAKCFPHGRTTQNVTGDDVNAEDAGTITCTVTISGCNYTSEPFTLRISGEQLVHIVIACIVYYKQCILLLFATCYCYIIHNPIIMVYVNVHIQRCIHCRNCSY